MSAEENLANAVKDWLLTEGHLSAMDGIAIGETPIEKILFGALFVCCRIGVGFMELHVGAPKAMCDIGLKRQHTIIDWPVDYVFEIISEKNEIHRLAVECDGHDFHERTKEQAKRDRSRDRALQEAGYTVFRFTGSEIYRNSFECARQIIRWAERASFA